MKAREIEIKLEQLTIAALAWGNVDSPPLIALHGWLDNAASFAPLAPNLDNFQLVAIDLPGHGNSQHLPQPSIYHFIDALHYFDKVIEALGWSKVNIIGHSLGGAIASLFAGAFPEKVSKLVIIEGLGPLSSPITETIPQIRDFALRQKHFARRHQTRLYPTLDDAAKARANKGYIELAQARILAERGTQALEGGFSWKHDPRLYLPSPLRLTEEQVLAFLSNIQTPVCFIKGSHGYEYSAEKMAARFAAVKSLEMHEVSGGHHLHMEQPQATANIIRNFFA